MKIVNKMPTSGQFVAVYEFDGFTWSMSFLFEDGAMYTCGSGADEMPDVTDKKDIIKDFLTSHNAIYIVGEE